MGGVKKKVGRRRKRTVGRPAKGYTIDGALIRKGFAQVQHESGTAHSMRAAGLSGHWDEYRDMLQQRDLHLFDKATAQGCLPAKFPRSRALACTPAKWYQHLLADEEWLQENIWVSGKDSKINKKGFVHLGHRYFRGALCLMKYPQLSMWVMFWRNPVLKVIYSYGLGVEVKKDIDLEDGEQKVLAYGLPDADDAERHKGLTVDFYDGSPRSVFGPFALFNGACKDHANCGISLIKSGDPFFPAWLAPDTSLAVISLVKSVEKGEELLADYQLDTADLCPICQGS